MLTSEFQSLGIFFGIFHVEMITSAFQCVGIVFGICHVETWNPNLTIFQALGKLSWLKPLTDLIIPVFWNCHVENPKIKKRSWGHHRLGSWTAKVNCEEPSPFMASY
jgi:hypothetical protein